MTNAERQMPNAPNGAIGAKVKEQRAYDLAERTAKFGKRVIGLARKIPRSPVTLPLIRQLVRSGTGVGTNNCEADDVVSRKDFRNKIGICRKESREAKHWLRMIATANEELKAEARALWSEAKELNLIFSKVFRSAGA